MAIRQVIPFSIYDDDAEKLESIAAKEFNSRSRLLAKAVHRVTESPESLGNTIVHLMKMPIDEAVRTQTPSSLSINQEQAEKLNSISKRLGISKTVVLNLIVKGMVLGYI